MIYYFLLKTPPNYSKEKTILKKFEYKDKPFEVKEGCHILLNYQLKGIQKLKCKDFYWAIIAKNKTEPTCIGKWEEAYPNFKNVNSEVWPRIFMTPFRTTRETALQSFQYRLIHRIIPTNKWLFEKQLRDNNICKFCNNVDTITHFFITCNKTDQFWTYFYNWWHRTTQFRIINDDIYEECILFGYPGDEPEIEVMNYCILLAKYYIYCKKLNDCNVLDLYEYLVIVKSKLSIEKTICERNNRTFEKWELIYNNL